jgi:hypothetical protein
MKRKHSERQKLVIRSETIREINRKELDVVQGGESTDACTTSHAVEQFPKL